MSRENLDRLVAGYAAFNDRDSDALLGFLAPDFVYRPRPELPGNAPTVGPDEFQRAVRGLWDVVAAARFEVEEVIDLDDRIIAVIRQTGQGSSSGAPVEQQVAHLWQLEAGKATALWVFTTRDEALEAVGLSE
jgi:ketosteroid isomerase-like protein